MKQPLVLPLLVQPASMNVLQEKQIIVAQVIGFKKESASIILQQDVMNGLTGLIMKIAIVMMDARE